MRYEPSLPWDGPFPYAIAARFGISPESSIHDVREVSFDLTPADLEDEHVTRALTDLESSRARLTLDFFCSPLPPPAETAAAGARAPRALPWRLLAELTRSLPAPLPEKAATDAALPPTYTGSQPLWEAGVTFPPEVNPDER